MSDRPALPDIAIGRIAIRGVDPGTAQSLGPAIERAMADAAAQGLLTGSRAALRLDLPSGATSRDVARALARALRSRG